MNNVSIFFASLSGVIAFALYTLGRLASQNKLMNSYNITIIITDNASGKFQEFNFKDENVTPLTRANLTAHVTKEAITKMMATDPTFNIKQLLCA